MNWRYLWPLWLLLVGGVSGLRAQAIEMALEERMVSLERDVVRTYNELQKYLYENPEQENELSAFESLLSIYVDEILNLYDTFWRLKGTTLESHQNIAARSLIFRALTMLENTARNPENYKKACDDYKKALFLTQNELRQPLLSTKLPYEVWIGHKLYTRLADLLDNRGKNFQMLDCFRMSDRRHQFGKNK
ncbi:MAG: hypothetical protein ACE5HO_17150 [bacterium]